MPHSVAFSDVRVLDAVRSEYGIDRDYILYAGIYKGEKTTPAYSVHSSIFCPMAETPNWWSRAP